MSSITSFGTWTSDFGAGVGASSGVGVGPATTCLALNAGFVGSTAYPMAKQPPTIINKPVPYIQTLRSTLIGISSFPFSPCSSVYSNRIQVDETIFWPVDVLMVFAIDSN
jgi:hypothetical protein